MRFKKTYCCFIIIYLFIFSNAFAQTTDFLFGYITEDGAIAADSYDNNKITFFRKLKLDQKVTIDEIKKINGVDWMVCSIVFEENYNYTIRHHMWVEKKFVRISSVASGDAFFKKGEYEKAINDYANVFQTKIDYYDETKNAVELELLRNKILEADKKMNLQKLYIDKNVYLYDSILYFLDDSGNILKSIKLNYKSWAYIFANRFNQWNFDYDWKPYILKNKGIIYIDSFFKDSNFEVYKFYDLKGNFLFKIEENKTFQLIPSPNEEYFLFTPIDPEEGIGGYSIKLYNLSGKLVKEIKLNDSFTYEFINNGLFFKIIPSDPSQKPMLLDKDGNQVDTK